MKINTIVQGNCLDVLKAFPDESIDCCITSPPYWGLRDYGTATWEGGSGVCDHKTAKEKSRYDYDLSKAQTGTHGGAKAGTDAPKWKSVCPSCGAVKVDSQLGLEKTPEEYVDNMVKVFGEVKRVLKKEGTLWLNLGDSYLGGGFGTSKDESYDLGKQGTNRGTADFETRKKLGSLKKNHPTLKQKDMVGIPWRTAFALQADGWYLRQDIIWAKPNPMPESVTDRCTKSHEYIFLLTKSPRYYFDNEAIKEPTSTFDDGVRDRDTTRLNNTPGRTRMAGLTTNDYETRNKRSVWTVATKPYAEAHFATYPPELITPCVRAGCPPKGIILDPFFGAGTTGLVAQQSGRNYVGIELNKDYIKIAENRLNQQVLAI